MKISNEMKFSSEFIISLGETPVSTPPPLPPPNAYQAPPGFSDADRHALNKLNLFALMFLIISIISIATTVYDFSFMFALFPMSSSGIAAAALSSLQFFSSFFYYIAIIVIVSVVVELIALVQLRSALKGLAGVEKSRFGTPSKLVFLMIVAIPLIFVALILFFAGFSSFMSTLSQSGSSSSLSSFPFGYFLGGGALLFVAGIMGLIGFIGGMMLGVWRIGSRYKEDLIKVGGILFIIPFLSIIAPILIMFGVRNARRKIGMS